MGSRGISVLPKWLSKEKFDMCVRVDNRLVAFYDIHETKEKLFICSADVKQDENIPNTITDTSQK
jgi:hypothetical protein